MVVHSHAAVRIVAAIRIAAEKEVKLHVVDFEEKLRSYQKRAEAFQTKAGSLMIPPFAQQGEGGDSCALDCLSLPLSQLHPCLCNNTFPLSFTVPFLLCLLVLSLSLSVCVRVCVCGGGG